MKIQVLKNESYSDISNLPTRGTLRSTGYDIVATSDPEIVGEKNEFGYSRIDYIQYKTNLKIAVYHSSRHYRDYDVLVMPRIWDKYKKIQGILLSLYLQHGRHQVNWFGVANLS